MAMDTEDMMKLDVLLTDAYLLLGLHHYGKVDSEKEGPKTGPYNAKNRNCS